MRLGLITALVLVIVITGAVLFYNPSSLTAPKPPITVEKENYTTKPFMECVACVDGETWNNKPCCTDNFANECSARNGVVRKTDMHPAFNGFLNGCFQKAPDAGKSCSNGNDCLSTVCDLEGAIRSNVCQLTEKRLTGEKSQYYDVDFYVATYSCKNSAPGTCTEAPADLLNPGGVKHSFKMQGKILIETLESGPIN